MYSKVKGEVIQVSKYRDRLNNIFITTRSVATPLATVRSWQPFCGLASGQTRSDQPPRSGRLRLPAPGTWHGRPRERAAGRQEGQPEPAAATGPPTPRPTYTGPAVQRRRHGCYTRDLTETRRAGRPLEACQVLAVPSQKGSACPEEGKSRPSPFRFDIQK